MSIHFGNYKFEDPVFLHKWEPPYKAGIYIICTAQAIFLPDYKPVYIGESGNMNERGFSSHHKRHCWVAEAGSEDKLWITTYLMPYSTEEERKAVEKELIQKYDPPCNK